jgi:SAM domain (Sterile alpha motif)
MPRPGSAEAKKQSDTGGLGKGNQGGLDMTVWPCKSGAMTSKGMIIDVGGWLRGLGLGQYEAAFRQNEIDERVLPSLTQEDLKEIGVATPSTTCAAPPSHEAGHCVAALAFGIPVISATIEGN